MSCVEIRGWVQVPITKSEADHNANIFDELAVKVTIFRDREMLSNTYIPDRLPHRDQEIRQIALILNATFLGSRPSNILIYGQTGTGKTAVIKYLGLQMDEKASRETTPVHFVYINCKQVNTAYGIMANIGHHFTTDWEETIPFTGWPLEKVYSALQTKIDEAGGVTIIVLDEIDWLVTKSGDDVLYHLTTLNETLTNSKVSIIGVSNNTKFAEFLDPRVKSRLGEESLTFPPYKAPQLRDILEQRSELAFLEGAVEKGVIAHCAARAAQEHGDARKALDLLRIAGELAERKSAANVTKDFVNEAESMMEYDSLRKVITALPIQQKTLLLSIYLNESKANLIQQTTGDVYNTYRNLSRRFDINILTQRRVADLISELDMLGIINARVVSLGRGGRTRFINVDINPQEMRSILDADSFMNMVLDSTEDDDSIALNMAQSRLI